MAILYFEPCVSARKVYMVRDSKHKQYEEPSQTECLNVRILQRVTLVPVTLVIWYLLGHRTYGDVTGTTVTIGTDLKLL